MNASHSKLKVWKAEGMSAKLGRCGQACSGCLNEETELVE